MSSLTPSNELSQLRIVWGISKVPVAVRRENGIMWIVCPHRVGLNSSQMHC